jgi:hypothetical protein
MIIICEHCKKEYQICPSWYKRRKRHFCSPKCYQLATVGERTKHILKVGSKTRFKPGQKPSENRNLPNNISHHAWKGNDVGYRGLHYWLRRIKGIPEKCSECGSTKSVQWANIDHKYNRNVDDYVAMCASCHKIHDINLRLTNQD